MSLIYHLSPGKVRSFQSSSDFIILFILHMVVSVQVLIIFEVVSAEE